MARKKQDPRVTAAFDEVYARTPKTVKKAHKTGKAKERMLTAIALSKARAAGAKVPIRRRPQGSGVFTDKEIQAGCRILKI